MSAMPNLPTGYLQMLKAALASFAPGGGQSKPAPGQPGSAVTPEMAAIASQNLPGTNFQGATVQGVMPGAPPVPPSGGENLLNGLGAAAPQLAKMLDSGDGKDPRMRKLPPHQGQGTPGKPISANPTPQAPPPSQGQGAPPQVPSVGAFLTSPAGQQLMQQMQKALGIGAR